MRQVTPLGKVRKPTVGMINCGWLSPSEMEEGEGFVLCLNILYATNYQLVARWCQNVTMNDIVSPIFYLSVVCFVPLQTSVMSSGQKVFSAKSWGQRMSWYTSNAFSLYWFWLTSVFMCTGMWEVFVCIRASEPDKARKIVDLKRFPFISNLQSFLTLYTCLPCLCQNLSIYKWTLLRNMVTLKLKLHNQGN